MAIGLIIKHLKTKKI